MPGWSIKSVSNVEICTVKSVEKHGQLMSGRWLTVDIDSAVALPLEAGCYMEFDGVKYSIRSQADVEKSARQLSHGGAFTYKDLRLDDVSWQELEDTEMTDYVYEDNMLHYTGLGTFSFYMTKVSDMGYRVQAVLDNKYGTGADGWTVNWPSFPALDNLDEAKSISISAGTSVKETLDMLWQNWGIIYTVNRKTITLRPSSEGSIMLSYGKGNGLKKIARKLNPNVEICTRVRAYGSERNMPYKWYNNKYDDVNEAMFVPQLMLPHTVAYYDAEGNYVNDAGRLYVAGDDEVVGSVNIWATPNDVVLENVVKSTIYGKRDKEIHWNSDDMGEIFPSMKGMTATEVGVDSDTWADDRLDLLLSTAVNEDGTTITGTGDTSELTTGKINFKVQVPNPGFDPMAQKGQEDVVLLMQSGKCQSRGFVILKSEAVISEGQTVAYNLTCVKAIDDEIDQVFPNGTYTINGGEEYVYTGLTFSGNDLSNSWLAVYIGAAEKRLLRAAALWLREHQTEQYVYEITPDNIYLQKQKDEDDDFEITEGDTISLSQDDLGDSDEVVETVTVVYGKDAIPTYEITFLKRDESESLGDRVKGLVGQTISVDSDIAKMNDSLYKKVNKTGFHTLFDPLDSQYNVLDINGDLSTLKYIRANVDFFSVKGVAALGTGGPSGGGGGGDLNEPLASINDAGLADHPSASGQTIVWNGTQWTYGNAGGGGGGGITTVNVPSTGLLTGGSVSGTTLTLNTRSIQANDIPTLPYVQRSMGVEMYKENSYVAARLLNSSGSYDSVRHAAAAGANGYIEWYAGDTYRWMNHAMGHLILNDANGQIWGDTSGNKKFTLPSTSGTLALLSDIPTTMPWSNITGKPTTLSGYGITDAKITNGTITLGSDTLTPLTKVSYNNSATLTSPYYVVTSGSVGGNTLTLGRRKLSDLLNAAGYTWWGQTMNSNGVVSGDMTSVGNITMSGNINMNTSQRIYFSGKNTLEVDSGSLAIGYGYRTDLPMGLYGTAINFYPNGSKSASVESGGVIVGTSTTDTTHYIQIGGGRIYWDDDNNALYVQKANGAACNLYSLGGVSALGIGVSGTASLNTLSVSSLTAQSLTVQNKITLPSTIVATSGAMLAKNANDSDGVFLFNGNAYSASGYEYYYNQYDNVGLHGTNYDYSDTWKIDPDGDASFNKVTCGTAQMMSNYIYINARCRLYANGGTVSLQTRANTTTTTWTTKETWS